MHHIYADRSSPSREFLAFCCKRVTWREDACDAFNGTRQPLSQLTDRIMRRYELTDQQWDLIADLFPEQTLGRPRRSFIASLC